MYVRHIHHTILCVQHIHHIHYILHPTPHHHHPTHHPTHGRSTLWPLVTTRAFPPPVSGNSLPMQNTCIIATMRQFRGSSLKSHLQWGIRCVGYKNLHARHMKTHTRHMKTHTKYMRKTNHITTHSSYQPRFHKNHIHLTCNLTCAHIHTLTDSCGRHVIQLPLKASGCEQVWYHICRCTEKHWPCRCHHCDCA